MLRLIEPRSENHGAITVALLSLSACSSTPATHSSTTTTQQTTVPATITTTTTDTQTK